MKRPFSLWVLSECWREPILFGSPIGHIHACVSSGTAQMVVRSPKRKREGGSSVRSFSWILAESLTLSAQNFPGLLLPPRWISRFLDFPLLSHMTPHRKSMFFVVHSRRRGLFPFAAGEDLPFSYCTVHSRSSIEQKMERKIILREKFDPMTTERLLCSD